MFPPAIMEDAPALTSHISATTELERYGMEMAQGRRALPGWRIPQAWHKMPVSSPWESNLDLDTFKTRRMRTHCSLLFPMMIIKWNQGGPSFPIREKLGPWLWTEQSPVISSLPSLLINQTIFHFLISLSYMSFFSQINPTSLVSGRS